jgi:2-methylaconitate cis-trans-isomerase PrpF
MREIDRDRISLSLMRGGTSRGAVVVGSFLPDSSAERDELVLRVLGGTVPQTDGLGGGEPTTSKFVVVSPTKDNAEGAVLDFAVGNVVVGKDAVDWQGTCGNMTSTVAPFAVGESLVPRTADGLYRLRNLSTGMLIDATVHDVERYAPGRATRVTTTFLNPTGTVTGRLFPLGSPRDVIRLAGRDYDCSVLDVTHPYLFLRHEQVVQEPGFGGLEGARDLVERLRGEICLRLGLVSDPMQAMTLSPAIPRVVLVHSGAGKGSDLVVSPFSMGAPIKTVPVTAAMCLAAAAQLKSTIVSEVYSNTDGRSIVRVRSEQAAIEAAGEVDADGNVSAITVERDVRTIMSGFFWL